ncbi:HdeD family acid-resistance protein [Brevibacterium linens]|uniref:HdeD family acid-resistance protein n=1 Tax=Brevibacterium linens TaxID=1703 RepID=UPI003BF53754
MSTSPASEPTNPKANSEQYNRTPEAPSSMGEWGSKDFSRGTFWVLIIRGIVAVVLGLLLILAPSAVVVILGISIGAWLCGDGVLTILNSITSRKNGDSWGWELASGIAFALIGVVVVLLPSIFTVVTGSVILWMAAFGMLTRGILGLFSQSLRRWSKVMAVVDIVFALALMLALLFNPTATVVALLLIVGVYAIVLGLIMVTTAISVRSQAKQRAVQ